MTARTKADGNGGHAPRIGTVLAIAGAVFGVIEWFDGRLNDKAGASRVEIMESRIERFEKSVGSQFADMKATLTKGIEHAERDLRRHREEEAHPWAQKKIASLEVELAGIREQLKGLDTVLQREMRLLDKAQEERIDALLQRVQKVEAKIDKLANGG